VETVREMIRLGLESSTLKKGCSKLVEPGCRTVEDGARELLSVAGSSGIVWLDSEGVPEGTAGKVSSDADSAEAVRIVAVSGASELLAMGEYVLPLTDASDCSTSMDTSNVMEDDIVPLSLDRGYSRLEDMSRFASNFRLLG